MIQKRLLLFLLACSLSLQACSILKPGTESYTIPESSKTLDMQVENELEKMAKGKHVKLELSDTFAEQYFNMDTFAELKERTKNGIAVTNDMADMSEKEYQLWKDIIATERLNQMTVEDLAKKQQELMHLLEEMANEHALPLEEFVWETYGLKMGQLQDFIKRQAEKYWEPKEENTDELQEANMEAPRRDIDEIP